MKKLSTYLFLIFFSFQTSSWADDIRDFQIEGMSVGDSLLDYVSEHQIKTNKKDYTYKNDKFYAIDFDNIISSKIYDGIGISLKKNDKKYLIHSIYGVIFYQNNIHDCYKKKDSIVEELNTLFKDVKIDDQGTYPSGADPSGKTKTTSIWYNFEFSEGTIGVLCQDWSKEFEKEKGWTDNLRVSIRSEEFRYWINNEAY